MILHHGYTNDYIRFRRVEKPYISSVFKKNTMSMILTMTKLGEHIAMPERIQYSMRKIHPHFSHLST